MYSTSVPLKFRFCATDCRQYQSRCELPKDIIQRDAHRPGQILLTYHCYRCSHPFEKRFSTEFAIAHSNASLIQLLQTGSDVLNKLEFYADAGGVR
jgi:hypothetical protein